LIGQSGDKTPDWVRLAPKETLGATKEELLFWVLLQVLPTGILDETDDEMNMNSRNIPQVVMISMIILSSRLLPDVTR
jgi:hypothetical protein